MNQISLFFISNPSNNNGIMIVDAMNSYDEITALSKVPDIWSIKYKEKIVDIIAILEILCRQLLSIFSKKFFTKIKNKVMRNLNLWYNKYRKWGMRMEAIRFLYSFDDRNGEMPYNETEMVIKNEALNRDEVIECFIKFMNSIGYSMEDVDF